MSPLNSFPKSPIFVRASVIAVSLWASPSRATPPPDPSTAQADADAHVVSAGASEEEARVNLVITALDGARARLGRPLYGDARAEAEALLSVNADWIKAAEVREVAAGHVEVTYTLPFDYQSLLVAKAIEVAMVKGLTVAGSLTQQGLRVLAVLPGTKGVLVGDIITHIGAERVLTIPQLTAALSAKGKRVGLTVLRDQKPQTVTLKEAVIQADPVPFRDRVIQRAPTCGPCCHGHCDDPMDKMKPPEVLQK
jgi:hypothetical protein